MTAAEQLDCGCIVSASKRVARGIVRADPIAWVRRELDAKRLGQFVELLAGDNEALPPLHVVELGDGSMLVSDGAHRLAAAEERDLDEVAVRVLDCGPRDPRHVGWLHGLHTAARAALPLSHPDRRRAALRLFAEQPDLSSRSIAHLVGASNSTVGRWRDELAREKTEGDPEAGGEVEFPPGIDEVVRRLASGMARVWDSRGLSEHAIRLVGGEARVDQRIGVKLAEELVRVHSDGTAARAWARRLRVWGAAAEAALEGSAVTR